MVSKMTNVKNDIKNYDNLQCFDSLKKPKNMCFFIFWYQTLQVLQLFDFHKKKQHTKNVC